MSKLMHPDFLDYKRDISYGGDSIITWIRDLGEGQISIKVLGEKVSRSTTIIEKVFDFCEKDLKTAQAFLRGATNDGYDPSRGYNYVLNSEQYKKILRSLPKKNLVHIHATEKDHIEALWPSEGHPSCDKFRIIQILLMSQYIFNEKFVGGVYYVERRVKLIWHCFGRVPAKVIEDTVHERIIEVHPFEISNSIWSLQAVKCALPFTIHRSLKDPDDKLIGVNGKTNQRGIPYSQELYEYACRHVQELEWNTLEETGVIINLKDVKRQFEESVGNYVDNPKVILSPLTKRLLDGIDKLPEGV